MKKPTLFASMEQNLECAVVVKTVIFVGFLLRVVVKCSHVSKQNAASIFKVTELFEVDADLTPRKNDTGYTERFVASHS